MLTTALVASPLAAREPRGSTLPNPVPKSNSVDLGGSRADLSAATGFKHSALSVLGIALRPPSAVPLSPWLAALAAAAGMRRPTLLLLDGVIKPENVGVPHLCSSRDTAPPTGLNPHWVRYSGGMVTGSLFRSALAFGVAGAAPSLSGPRGPAWHLISTLFESTLGSAASEAEG